MKQGLSNLGRYLAWLGIAIVMAGATVIAMEIILQKTGVGVYDALVAIWAGWYLIAGIVIAMVGLAIGAAVGFPLPLPRKYTR